MRMRKFDQLFFIPLMSYVAVIWSAVRIILICIFVFILEKCLAAARKQPSQNVNYTAFSYYCLVTSHWSPLNI